MDNFEQKLIAGLTELKTAIGSEQTSRAALQAQVDAIDRQLKERTVASPSSKSLAKFLETNDAARSVVRSSGGGGKGSFSLTIKQEDCPELFERKTTITSSAVGQAVSGILMIDRIPGITTEAREQLSVRDLLSARPTTMQVVDFVKVNTPMTIASPVVETNTKPENAVTFTSISEKVRLLATWIPASRQILDDFTELAGFINTSMPYYVNLEEELQLLSGSGSGEDLHGLVTQATAFNTSYLQSKPGWTKIDIIARAIEQIRAAKEIQPTFCVLHPNDWWDMRLTKDSFGRYLLGDPTTPAKPSLWGLDVCATTSISAGSFLVGSGLPVAAEIRDRMEMQVDISTENGTYFVQNLVAIRAEKRLALIVKRPASYITGSFTTSP